MMTHPGPETLLAHVDRELPHEEANAVAGHIATCATCSLAVTDLRETAGAFAATLSSLDRLEPASWASPAAADVQVIPLPTRGAAGSGVSGWGPLRRAAAILLLTAAAASAAIVTNRAVRSGSDAEAPAGHPAALPRTTVTSVSVAPSGGVVNVALAGIAAGSTVHVTRTDDADASVSIESAATPHFTAADGRVDVDLQGSAATVTVHLPRGLRAGRVTANGALLASLVDGRIVPEAAGESGIVVGGTARRPEE